jgi:hypothetical protein
LIFSSYLPRKGYELLRLKVDIVLWRMREK